MLNINKYLKLTHEFSGSAFQESLVSCLLDYHARGFVVRDACTEACKKNPMKRFVVQ